MMYPYMEGYTEETIGNFIGGEVFFTVKADQSTHTLYTSSDLIAGGCYELQEKASGSKGIIKTCNSGNGQWACVIPPQSGEPKIHITTTDNKEFVFKAPSEIEFPQPVRTNLLLTLNDNSVAKSKLLEHPEYHCNMEYCVSSKGG